MVIQEIFQRDVVHRAWQTERLREPANLGLALWHMDPVTREGKEAALEWFNQLQGHINRAEYIIEGNPANEPQIRAEIAESQAAQALIRTRVPDIDLRSAHYAELGRARRERFKAGNISDLTIFQIQLAREHEYDGTLYFFGESLQSLQELQRQRENTDDPSEQSGLDDGINYSQKELSRFHSKHPDINRDYRLYRFRQAYDDWARYKYRLVRGIYHPDDKGAIEEEVRQSAFVLNTLESSDEFLRQRFDTWLAKRSLLEYARVDELEYLVADSSDPLERKFLAEQLDDLKLHIEIMRFANKDVAKLYDQSLEFQTTISNVASKESKHNLRSIAKELDLDLFDLLKDRRFQHLVSLAAAAVKRRGLKSTLTRTARQLGVSRSFLTEWGSNPKFQWRTKKPFERHNWKELGVEPGVLFGRELRAAQRKAKARRLFQECKLLVSEQQVMHDADPDINARAEEIFNDVTYQGLKKNMNRTTPEKRRLWEKATREYERLMQIHPKEGRWLEINSQMTRLNAEIFDLDPAGFKSGEYNLFRDGGRGD